MFSPTEPRRMSRCYERNVFPVTRSLLVWLALTSDIAYVTCGVCTIFLIRFFLIGKTSQMFNICYVFPNCIFSDFVMFFLILLGFS